MNFILYILNWFLVSNRVPSTRPAAPASQRDRGDHKIDELTRQVSSVII